MKRVVLLLAALLLLVGGVAYASIPAPDGTINGCRQDSTGNMRVIDSTETCPTGWSPLNWPSQDRYAYWANGFHGTSVGSGSQVVLVPGATATAVANCPAGKLAIQSAFYKSPTLDIDLTSFVPAGTAGGTQPPTGWEVTFRSDEDPVTGQTGTGTVIAYCVDPNPFP